MTISISPIVWADEICFNAITIDWMQHKSFFYTIDPLWSNAREVLVYGPVYFIMNSSIISVLGNNLFGARLLCLLSGFVWMIFFYLIIRKHISKKYIVWFLLAILLDLFVSACMHNGRMDLTTLVFFISASMLLINNKSKLNQDYLQSILVGLLFSLAILTTPRVLIFIPALLPFLLKDFELKKFLKDELLHYAIITTIVVSIFLCWIFYAFGSIHQYFDYFNFAYHYAAIHQDGKFFIAKVNLPVVCIAVISLLLMVIYNYKLLLKPIISSSIIWVISFYIFVRDVGPYGVFVIPVFYLLFALTFESYRGKKIFKFAGIGLLILLISINSIIFSLKLLVLMAQADARNYNHVVSFVAENIPAGSKVCGDDVYYYAAYQNKNPFILMKSYQGDDKRQKKYLPLYQQIEKYRRENFKYEYLIVSDRIKKRISTLTELYLNNSSLEKVAEYKTPTNNILKWLSQKNLYMAADEYNGVIYKRVK